MSAGRVRSWCSQARQPLFLLAQSQRSEGGTGPLVVCGEVRGLMSQPPTDLIQGDGPDAVPPVKSRRGSSIKEADAIKAGLEDPEIKAFVTIIGILRGLSSDRARERVFTNVQLKLAGDQEAVEA